MSDTTTDVCIASGVTPDAVRTWYEVPEQIVEMLRETIDPDETFAECLLRLLLERQGTYRQVVRENQRLRTRPIRADDYAEPLRGMIERGEIEPPDEMVIDDA